MAPAQGPAVWGRRFRDMGTRADAEGALAIQQAAGQRCGASVLFAPDRRLVSSERQRIGFGNDQQARGGGSVIERTKGQASGRPRESTDRLSSFSK